MGKPARKHESVLGERFVEALGYAARLHLHQSRKGGGTPYVGHLLAVASLVLEAAGDEDQVIAALLHDAVEDQGGTATLAEITRRFGGRVAAIVEGCSDPWGEPRPPWIDRKRATLERLRIASPDVLLVAVADRLHNAQTMRRDHGMVGERLWERFRGSREQQLWYYEELASIFEERIPGWLSDSLAATVRDLRTLLEHGDEVSGGQDAVSCRPVRSGGQGFDLQQPTRRLLESDASPLGRDGHGRDKDAGSARSSATGATEDAVSRRSVRSGGQGFDLQQPPSTDR